MASSTLRDSPSDWFTWLHCCRLAALLVLAPGLGGCASTTLNVVQNGQLIEGSAIAGVDVVHRGVRMQPQHRMALEVGDEIETDAQSTVVLGFADGARVYVQPATHVRLGSIFVFFGEVLVKVKGYFKVQTEYATAASEGTEYLVRVDPEQRVRVVAAEDSVGLTSNSGRWTRTSLAVGRAASIVGAGLLEVGPANAGEVEQIRRRISDLDKLVPTPSNFGTAALVGGIFAIGVGTASSRGSHDSYDDVRQPPSEPAPRGRVPQPLPKEQK